MTEFPQQGLGRVGKIMATNITMWVRQFQAYVLTYYEHATDVCVYMTYYEHATDVCVCMCVCTCVCVCMCMFHAISDWSLFFFLFFLLLST